MPDTLDAVAVGIQANLALRYGTARSKLRQVARVHDALVWRDHAGDLGMRVAPGRDNRPSRSKPRYHKPAPLPDAPVSDAPVCRTMEEHAAAMRAAWRAAQNWT